MEAGWWEVMEVSHRTAMTIQLKTYVPTQSNPIEMCPRFWTTVQLGGFTLHTDLGANDILMWSMRFLGQQHWSIKADIKGRDCRASSEADPCYKHSIRDIFPQKAWNLEYCMCV